MKKRTGIKKALDIIPKSELSQLSTGALLARLKRLRWCLEKPEDASDLTPDELEGVQDKILFKSDERWKQAYADLKSVLNTREHKSNIS